MTLTDRLDQYLRTAGLEAVWFARPNSFAWLTGGGDNVVDREVGVGVAAAGYDGDEIRVVTDNIEAPRLRDEELDSDVPVETFDWHAQSLADAVAEASPTPAAADFDIAGFESVDATQLRQPLTETQIEQCRDLARDTADAVEAVARNVEPSHTELDVTAVLRQKLEGRGIATPVVLVGSAERAQSYRHYTPTDTELGDYALISVTVQRNGLHVSATRAVAFDPPEWLMERTHKAARVETTALAATQVVGRDGGTAGEVFDAIQNAYAEVGWEGEWENHHQGGATGFAGREWIATPGHAAGVALPHGYAWNPTIAGTKSEDTYRVSADDIELLSETGNWPTETVSAVGYDLELPRHTVLEL
ncbi:M24 family metallopeptidase [Haloarcula sp. CBA1130]|uniref:M24 family metallopeptidase n=1 Tax=unclassified Haloarcula TaxID=2624677 RepID=UPI001247D2C4|nr:MULTISPECIES: M24 family metallopeptidase [unclassified Haloarcula]KAA9398553.1 M24 family metallopeptidase [Haloarcula sp. CBA1129]KAA9403069.1 M24 family metallopeptidase [Haloarcula sp. CBA1130]